MLYGNIFIRIDPEVNGGNPVFWDEKYCILINSLPPHGFG
jgi:hypothetical protein